MRTDHVGSHKKSYVYHKDPANKMWEKKHNQKHEKTENKLQYKIRVSTPYLWNINNLCQGAAFDIKMI